MSREMKYSGIPWIGEIPKDWSNAKYRYSGVFVKGKLPHEQNVEQLGKPIIGASEMLGKECRNFSTDENIPTCQKEDVIILWDGANAGIVANNCEGIVSSTVVKYVCTDKKFDTQYLFYLLKNGEPFFKSKVNGTTIPHMNQKYIDEYLCIQPSLVEQQRIAEFLDKKCGEIDEMVALQEKMIEELKAYKQSVITEAVTKGLNPNVPMRDSGIEWIGSIPEHWEVRRIKFIGKAENGLTYSPNDVCDESEGILVLRSSNIQNGKLAFDDNVYVRSVPDSLRVRVGDIIICSRNGSASLVGKSALVDSEIDASFGAFMMRFRSNHNHKYIHFLLTATISHYKQLFTTTTINQLTIGLINNITMPFVEDATEQQAIADYLDEKCADIDSLIQTKQEKIDSLKEYKKSIIYEYVTGKREIV